MTDTVKMEIYTPTGTVLVEVGPDGWEPLRWSDAMSEEAAWAAVAAFRKEHGALMANAPIVEAKK